VERLKSYQFVLFNIFWNKLRSYQLSKLNTSISKAALRSGLSVFLFLLILLFSKAGSFLLFAICVAPGLVYGLALTTSAKNPVSAFGKLFLILLAMTINIGCVYYVSNDFLDLDYNQYAAFKSVTCSTIGAILFTLCYDLLILRRFSVFRTIVMPSIMGMVSSLFSAFCMYLIVSGSYNEFVSASLWVGMLSIFPLWQYLIGLNIYYHSRPV
jgi:hypothetical protein